MLSTEIHSHLSEGNPSGGPSPVLSHLSQILSHSGHAAALGFQLIPAVSLDSLVGSSLFAKMYTRWLLFSPENHPLYSNFQVFFPLIKLFTYLLILL